MEVEVTVRALRREGDRSRFSCGQDDLDRFFHHYAGQNQFKYGLSVTYVAEVDQQVAGFATVCGSEIERDALPDRRLRTRLPSYPLPVVRIARLGVDTGAQRKGIASSLLRHVLLLALEQRDTTGCVGVVVDAKTESVAFYDALGFVRLDGVRDGLLPADPVPMFLGLDTVAKARSRARPPR